MYEKPRFISVSGRVLKVAHPDLPGNPKSYLTASAAVGTSLTVQDNSGFAADDFVRVGKAGSEKSEVVRLNGAVTRGTALTVTTTTFSHSVGEVVEKVLFDQWRIYGNSTNTTTGATLIATTNIVFDAPHTTYINTGTEYAYYFVIGYNSYSAAASDVYSDGVQASTGHPENSVGSLITKALTNAKEKKGSRITDEWLNGEINDCMRFITGKLKHWSFLQSFDYALGTAMRGTFRFTLPSSIEDANSNKSILGVRVGSGDNLDSLDKREWETELKDVVHTDVRTQATSGQTTLEVDNSYDFADSGSVDVFVSGTKYTLTYTGVTRSTTAGVLTGIPASGTGSISVTIAVDTIVWQNEVEGQPDSFTVFDGSLYLWPLPDASYDYKNVVLDFYTSKTLVDSDSDTIEGPRYDAVKHWLTWKLRSLSNQNGALDMRDGDKLMFDAILKDLIKLETSGQKWKFSPKINRIQY